MKKAILLGIFLMGVNVPARLASTCSEGKASCITTGGGEQGCEQRRQHCLKTGSWEAVRGGYIKK